MVSINAEQVANKAIHKELKEKGELLSKLLEQKQLESSKSLWSYIYIVKCGEFYKIGYTFNLQSRVDSFKTSNPYKIEVEFSFKVSDAKGLEKRLHRIYENKRYHREWFTLDKQDIEEIKKLAYEQDGN